MSTLASFWGTQLATLKFLLILVPGADMDYASHNQACDLHTCI